MEDLGNVFSDRFEAARGKRGSAAKPLRPRVMVYSRGCPRDHWRLMANYGRLLFNEERWTESVAALRER